MAEIVYAIRKELGFENDDISNEVLKPEDLDLIPKMYLEYEIDAKRKQKKERRILSLARTYHSWETKESGACSSDTPFSMLNLRILKRLLNCDYEFLFCEIDTLHKYTDEFSQKLGLNVSTIEKLLCFNEAYTQDDTDSSSTVFSHAVITSLNKIIADDDLMLYLSWYLTNLSNTDYDATFDDEDEEESFSSIAINRPEGAVLTEDACLDGTIDVLNSETIHQVYWYTICSKLCHIRETHQTESLYPRSDLPSLDPSILAASTLTPVILTEDTDSFGERLQKWRKYAQYSQSQVADLICTYRKEHNLVKKVKGVPYIPEKETVLRTYQNWESKSDTEKETRLSLTDLFILKNIMKCDYEYLLGEINTLTVPSNMQYQKIGLSSDNIKKLKLYATIPRQKALEGSGTTETDKALETSKVPAFAKHILQTIDLIVTDDDLLSNLTYCLSDLPFYCNMKLCNILKPNTLQFPLPDQAAYEHALFPEENELRNVFFPKIFDRLTALRNRNRYNNQLITDRINKLYKNL